MYEITLERLRDSNNDRLWFSMNVKLGKLYLDMCSFDPLQRLLDQLYRFCETPYGDSDPAKATSLLDVYALDIQVRASFSGSNERADSTLCSSCVAL